MGKSDPLKSCSSDSELVQKIKAGEKCYFEILIRRYNGVLYKIGRSYRISHDDVQDLMQETYIAAYQNLVKFEERSSYKTWLIRIMLNKCYHWAQRPAHRVTSGFSELSPTESNYTPESMLYADAGQEILNRELGVVLEKCIEKLPVEYRTVFILRELEGFNIQETAAVANLSESNVKVRLNRARNMLRKELEKWYPHATVYEFNLIYCDQMVERVFQQI